MLKKNANIELLDVILLLLVSELGDCGFYDDEDVALETNNLPECQETAQLDKAPCHQHKSVSKKIN